MKAESMAETSAMVRRVGVTFACLMLPTLTLSAFAGEDAPRFVEASDTASGEKSATRVEGTAKPEESWGTGKSTVDLDPDDMPEEGPEPGERGESRPSADHADAAHTPTDRSAEQPVEPHQIEAAVEDAAEENRGKTKPEESWTSGKSTTDLNPEKDEK